MAIFSRSLSVSNLLETTIVRQVKFTQALKEIYGLGSIHSFLLTLISISQMYQHRFLEYIQVYMGDCILKKRYI